MPALSHQDWSIPQAKQILSHWATLATLLAGTQATLMAYYEKDLVRGQTYTFVIASSCAGLFLEVYGALLATATIIASISLQSPQAGSLCSSTPTARKPLSPRSLAILDRMTVACGYIIPLGAACELLGLAAYAAKYQSSSVVISMIVTLAFCVLTTLLAALLGWRAGSERETVLRKASRRPPYWQDEQRCRAPQQARRKDQVEDEGAGLMNSIR